MDVESRAKMEDQTPSAWNPESIDMAKRKAMHGRCISHRVTQDGDRFMMRLGKSLTRETISQEGHEDYGCPDRGTWLG